MILTDEEIAKGQEFLLIWQNITSRPFTTRELDFARAIESAVLRKLRERPADAWVNHLNHVLLCDPAIYGRECEPWQKFHIIPEEHE